MREVLIGFLSGALGALMMQWFLTRYLRWRRRNRWMKLGPNPLR